LDKIAWSYLKRILILPIIGAVAMIFLLPVEYQSQYQNCVDGKCREVTVLHSISYQIFGYGGIIHFPVSYEFGPAVSSSGGFHSDMPGLEHSQ
jgi:hypothetical protein